MRAPAVVRKAQRSLRAHGVLSHVLGLLLRARFQRAGRLIVQPAWPLPSVENRGGRIELGNVGLFNGVRFECWQDATIKVGDGSYLNRGV